MDAWSRGRLAVMKRLSDLSSINEAIPKKSRHYSIGLASDSNNPVNFALHFCSGPETVSGVENTAGEMKGFTHRSPGSNFSTMEMI